MSITFASSDTLKGKANDPNAFDFFSGKHPSTLKESDLYLMGVERRKRSESSSTASQARFAPYQRPTKPLESAAGGVVVRLDPRLAQVPLPARGITYSDLNDTEKADLVKTTYRVLIAEMSKLSRCVNCNASFRELDSIGKRKCVWHPGAQREGRWGCCDEKTDYVTEMTRRPVGCSECDHSSVEFDPIRHNFTEIPLALARMLNIPEDRYIVVHSEDNNKKSDLYRTCRVIRSTSTRVANRRTYRPPPTFNSAPINDMQILRDRLELMPDRRVLHYETPFSVDNYAGHFTPGEHLHH